MQFRIHTLTLSSADALHMGALSTELSNSSPMAAFNALRLLLW